VKRRRRRGVGGASIVEKHTERGQGALLGPVKPWTVSGINDQNRSFMRCIYQYPSPSIMETGDIHSKSVFIDQKVL
jgi:hypothetical protein